MNRRGTVHGARPLEGSAGTNRGSLPIIKLSLKYLRGDAAFAKPEIYEYLEDEGLSCFAIRLPANQVIHGKIRHLLTPPLSGAHPANPSFGNTDFTYQAASWDSASSGDCQGRVASRRTLYPRFGLQPDQQE